MSEHTIRINGLLKHDLLDYLEAEGFKIIWQEKLGAGSAFINSPNDGFGVEGDLKELAIAISYWLNQKKEEREVPTTLTLNGTNILNH